MRMKDVIISVTGVQHVASGPDAMELVTAGQYGLSDREIRLTWQESELTGMEGTKTSLTVRPGSVVMSREGKVNTRMEFEEGEKTLFPLRDSLRRRDHGGGYPPYPPPPGPAWRGYGDRLCHRHGPDRGGPQPLFYPCTGTGNKSYRRYTMANLIQEAKNQIDDLLQDACRRAAEEGELPAGAACPARWRSPRTCATGTTRPITPWRGPGPCTCPPEDRRDAGKAPGAAGQLLRLRGDRRAGLSQLPPGREMVRGGAGSPWNGPGRITAAATGVPERR